MREQQSSEGRLSAMMVGISAGLGAAIGATISIPDLPVDTLVYGALCWALIFGFVFKVWQMALEGLTLFPRR